jgi:hypothetical protein
LGLAGLEFGVGFLDFGFMDQVLLYLDHCIMSVAEDIFSNSDRTLSLPGSVW